MCRHCARSPADRWRRLHCAICLASAKDESDLQRSIEDDRLECRRCRELHPRSGAYSFDDSPPDRPRPLAGPKKGK
jgi:hypothetical protein